MSYPQSTFFYQKDKIGGIGIGSQSECGLRCQREKQKGPCPTRGHTHHLRCELPGLVALRAENHVLVRVRLAHTGHQTALAKQ